MLRLRQIDASAEPSPQLQLHFSQRPDLATDAPLLRQWLQQFAPISRLQTEISMDLVLIRFSFAEQTFYLHAEHYTEACWIDTDSAAADMLLSELHQVLAQDLL
jgi:hypothetical protein